MNWFELSLTKHKCKVLNILTSFLCSINIIDHGKIIVQLLISFLQEHQLTVFDVLFCWIFAENNMHQKSEKNKLHHHHIISVQSNCEKLLSHCKKINGFPPPKYLSTRWWLSHRYCQDADLVSNYSLVTGIVKGFCPLTRFLFTSISSSAGQEHVHFSLSCMKLWRRRWPRLKQLTILISILKEETRPPRCLDLKLNTSLVNVKRSLYIRCVEFPRVTNISFLQTIINIQV